MMSKTELNQVERDQYRRPSPAERGHAMRSGTIYQQASNITHVEEHDGRLYVVLRNVRGVLSVYGITQRGRLRRLDVIPLDTLPVRRVAAEAAAAQRKNIGP